MYHPFHHLVTGADVNDFDRNLLAPPTPVLEILTTNQNNRRAWLRSLLGAGATFIAILKGRDAKAMQVTPTSPPGRATTQALGEEGGAYRPPSDGRMTTQALGEEGGGYRPPVDGPVTTQALGEEGGSGFPPGRVTTFALGEEGSRYYPPRYPYRLRYPSPPRHHNPSGPLTTYALGEDGAWVPRLP